MIKCMAQWPTKIKLEHTFNKVVFIKSKIDCKTKICTLKVLKNIHKIKKIIGDRMFSSAPNNEFSQLLS